MKMSFYIAALLFFGASLHFSSGHILKQSVTDRTDGPAEATTLQPSVTLTTRLLSSVHPKLNVTSPTLEPVSSTEAAQSIVDTTNAKLLQPSTVVPSTKQTDDATSINRIYNVTEANTVEDDIASSSMPPETTSGTNDVENTTSEFEDQSTTDAISSTENSLEYLQTAGYKKVCGKRMLKSRRKRIVGGTDASIGRWPWQIAILERDIPTYEHTCGAVLLNENWAITAWHCVDGVAKKDLRLRLGELNFDNEDEPYPYEERRVQIIEAHPNYTDWTSGNDLALLQFDKPVTFKPHIIPVCLPDSDESFDGEKAFVTGWGRLNYYPPKWSSILQEVSVPVINHTMCEKMFEKAGFIEPLSDVFVCAGYEHGGHDQCKGDSGGPLVIQRGDESFLLVGTVSWGIGCARPNLPGVYTRISKNYKWIFETIDSP